MHLWTSDDVKQRIRIYLDRVARREAEIEAVEDPVDLADCGDRRCLGHCWICCDINNCHDLFDD